MKLNTLSSLEIGDLVADFETQKLRELTQSLAAVISVLESKPLKISTGQKHILGCMHCFSFKFLTNEVYENGTVQDIFVNITKEEQTYLVDENVDDHEDGLIPQDEKTCQKEICRKIWEASLSRDENQVAGLQINLLSVPVKYSCCPGQETRLSINAAGLPS